MKEITMTATLVTAHNIDKISSEGFRWMLLVLNNEEPAMVFVTETEEWIFPLTKGFEVHMCNTFLRSLNLGVDVKFESFRQYSELIMQCGLLLEEQQSPNDFDDDDDIYNLDHGNDNTEMDDVDTESPEYMCGIVKAMTEKFYDDFLINKKGIPIVPFEADTVNERLWNLTVNAIAYGLAEGLKVSSKNYE